MKNRGETIKNILKFGSIFFGAVVFLVLVFYLFLLPLFFNSSSIVKFLNNTILEKYNLILNIEGQKLETSIKPEIELEIKKLILKNKNSELVNLEDFEFEISFEKIFKKSIKLDELKAKKLSLNLNEIIKYIPQNNNQNKSAPVINIDFLNADIDLKECDINYFQNDNTVKLFLNDLKLSQYLDFELKTEVFKNNKKYIQVSLNAKENITLSDIIQISNLNVDINNSNLKINSKIENENINANIKTSKFDLIDIFNIINSDLIIPDGSKLLLPLNSPHGNVALDIDYKNGDLSGVIDVNNTGVYIKDVQNLPINVSDGKIKILKDKIIFEKLIGHYGKNKANKLTITGNIKDYYKTFDSNIEVESVITNEFFKDYLAPLINNTTLFVSKPSRTKVIYKSKNNIIDLIWFAQIDKGVNFGVSDEKSALSDFDRAVLGEFNINGNKFEIKNINYYIASNIIRGVKLQPILQMNALMDFAGNIDKIGFAFGREMPCEFLNVFLGEKLFKKGTIKGDLNIIFKNNIPYLKADMEINKTLIPSQRMGFKYLTLKTDKNLIKINALGRFKKANFVFGGNIKNELKAPFLIKNMSLDLDNVDVERILASFNSQNQDIKTEEINSEEDFSDDDDFMFDTNLIRIEDCKFSLQKGNYKDLTFGNIKADLTLDEKGVLKIKSNKFDIAQGISTLKVECDLTKLKYYIKLGVKGIDSNLMAKTLFNLDKEITGAAYGLIELFGDETLKMNGNIKFLINNGTIGKVGLVEYLLKIASVFRNPIVMVSPATIMDIISIPEGKFDKIEGNIEIKDNILAPINIKSYSKSLSALIKGKMDLERHDASLRIYTRFSSDKMTTFNILRSFSLNALANKVKMNSRNDLNYYESELSELPQIEVPQEKTQIFLTQVEGDVEHFNFLSSLKKIK